MFIIQLINVQYFCVLYFQQNNFHRDQHLATGALVPETGPKQKNSFICSVLRPVLPPATDDFERIIKVWTKCCPGIFYMRWKRNGTGEAAGDIDYCWDYGTMSIALSPTM